MCKKLLKVCDVPEEHFPLALEAFKTDSQGGTYGKRGDKPKVDSDMLDPWDPADKGRGIQSILGSLCCRISFVKCFV